MLQIGESFSSSAISTATKKREGGPILLGENHEELNLFFKVLGGMFSWNSKTFRFLQDLGPSQIISLLQLAHKYQAPAIGLITENQLLMEHFKDTLFKQPFNKKELFFLHYYAIELDLAQLKEISAKFCLQIDDLVDDLPSELDFITIKGFLQSPRRFQKRWEEAERHHNASIMVEKGHCISPHN